LCAFYDLLCNRFLSLNDSYENHDDRNDKQKVNESAKRIAGDQTKNPQYKQEDGNGCKHDQN